MLESSQDTRRESRSPVGFSPSINDPASARRRKASGSWAMIFAGVLALIAIVGFPIYGHMSGKLEVPGLLYCGMVIGGMFVAIALVPIAVRGHDTTWDSVVVGKQVFERKTYDKTNDMHSAHAIYECKAKRSNTKVLRRTRHSGGNTLRHKGGYSATIASTPDRAFISPLLSSHMNSD